MKIKLAIRYAFVSALLLALSAMPPVLDESKADPRTRCGTETTYYADAAKTQPIGGQTYTDESCGCQLSNWGSTSWYRTIVEFGCY